MFSIADRVLAYLGGGDLAQVEEHVRVVTEFVHGYTRGNGFDEAHVPCYELESVIISTVARTVSNPDSVATDIAGPFTRTSFKWDGFNLMEQAVLHRYRRRTA